MDSRGGGRTPRGKKGRGRGRGGPYDSRSPSSGASSPLSPSAQQSPTVSSSVSTSTPKAATTPTRDVQPKVAETPKQEMSATSPSLTKPVETEPQLKPALKKEDLEREPEMPPKKEEEKEKSDDEDKEKKKEDKEKPRPETEEKIEEKEKDKPPPTPEEKPTPTPAPEEKPKEEEIDKSHSANKSETEESEKTVEELQPAPPPTPVSSSLEEPIIPPIPEAAESKNASTSASSSTETKVEEALGKSQKAPKSATTLIVEAPETERSTDAPLTVEIEQSVLFPQGQGSSGGDTQPPASSSTSQGIQGHSRSQSVSPGYSYALIGPVGKPGYIGGVGIPDDQVDAQESARRSLARRESAIAAMQIAVKGFSKRQWILLIVFGVIDLLSGITISLQGPFFPAEAERKGATATEYGFVFGIFEFTMFLTSPVFGKYMHRLGPKTVFSVGILISSIAIISFGLLDKIDDHTTFISLCLVCRTFEALGCAGFFTATFTIIAVEFPESVATTFSSLETFFGIGLIVGPTVGGALFGVGGFPLPFFVVGGLLLITGLFSSFVMPKIGKSTQEERKTENEFGILTILKIPTVALAALSIASTSMSLGFVSATLEPHIRMFNLTPLQTGLVFIVNGGMYALTAPIFGYICDCINKPIYITTLGNLFIFLSFLLIGPASFMPFDTILWVTIVGLVIQGLGFGCCLVSGFIVGLQDAMKNGFPDNITTYGVASGLWTSMISLGAWVGPVLAGVLYDNFGFREASWLILATSAIVGVTIFMHTCYRSYRPSISDSESQPLLRSASSKSDIETPKPSTSYGSA